MDAHQKQPRWFLPFMAMCLGILIGGGIVYVIVKPATDAAQSAVSTLANDLQEIHGTATLLFDAQPTQSPAGIPILNGMAMISIGGTQVQSPQRSLTPRWYIPAKVIPVVYGDPSGTVVYYVDIQTKKMDGPYSPALVQPQ